MATPRKKYRIETHPSAGFGKAMNAPGVDPSETETDRDPGLAGRRHRELLDAIQRLHAAVEPQEAVSSRLLADYKDRIAEVRQLKNELDEVYQAIERTKKDIATLHANGFRDSWNARASDHLDAVVSGTEEATTVILSATEEIDQMAAMLQSNLKGSADAELAEDIQNQVIKIFEACNFQDLTGQRITKVIDAFSFIEERVVHMMELWGGIDAFSTIEPDPLPQPDGDKAMLHGPALEDAADRASQSDIDALFG